MKKTMMIAGAFSLLLGMTGLPMAEDMGTSKQDLAPSKTDTANPSYQTSTSEMGTIKTIAKSSAGFQITLVDDLGATKQFSVPKNVEVRDLNSEKTSVSKVKTGASVILYVSGDQVTKIVLRS